MIDIVLVEQGKRVFEVQNIDEILHNAVVLERVPARIDEGRLALEVHDAAEMLLVQRSPGGLNGGDHRSAGETPRRKNVFAAPLVCKENTK